MLNTKAREVWVDNVKVIACVLVVLGHFFQSMVKANILPENDLTGWFIRTIYYFHVPLFFICSGYLYQKLSKVENAKSWGENMLKKAINLGVPYFTFSFATWLLKTLFSSNTNNAIGGLADTLFIHPTAPYWYLYALFFIFLITPTFRNSTMAVLGFAVALIFKMLIIIFGGYGIQAVNYVLSDEIWFVIGMCMCVWKSKLHMGQQKIIFPIATGIAFVALSVLIYVKEIDYQTVNFIMGLIACYSVISLVSIIYRKGKQSTVFGYLTKYTMPVFLMHTLFAAPLRALLFKVGIQNAAVHIILGLTISFIGPMIVAWIMKKTRFLEFFLYPGKFVRIKRN